jgi:hypothetical protein
MPVPEALDATPEDSTSSYSSMAEKAWRGDTDSHGATRMLEIPLSPLGLPRHLAFRPEQYG